MKEELALVAAVVLASGCLHAATDTEPENISQPTDRELENNTIYLTGSGFQPSTITIQEGETVTWINNASQPMWIASNRHPTHTKYSGTSLSEHCQNGDQTSAAFDQCSSGNKFSFTFEKTGTWRYHNHLNPAQGGKVVVE